MAGLPSDIAYRFAAAVKYQFLNGLMIAPTGSGKQAEQVMSYEQLFQGISMIGADKRRHPTNVINCVNFALLQVPLGQEHLVGEASNAGTR